MEVGARRGAKYQVNTSQKWLTFKIGRSPCQPWVTHTTIFVGDAWNCVSQWSSRSQKKEWDWFSGWVPSIWEKWGETSTWKSTIDDWPEKLLDCYWLGFRLTTLEGKVPTETASIEHDRGFDLDPDRNTRMSPNCGHTDWNWGFKNRNGPCCSPTSLEHVSSCIQQHLFEMTFQLGMTTMMLTLDEETSSLLIGPNLFVVVNSCELSLFWWSPSQSINKVSIQGVDH